MYKTVHAFDFETPKIVDTFLVKDKKKFSKLLDCKYSQEGLSPKITYLYSSVAIKMQIYLGILLFVFVDYH